ncbi:hypothetical protein LZ31DRAFT_258536 [Colletotrichum somersetense]|nr:hypothetical protein LZ31DRAFT_258536 [Colletotrichum somersetense]
MPIGAATSILLSISLLTVPESRSPSTAPHIRHRSRPSVLNMSSSAASCPDGSSLPDFVNIHGIPSNINTGFVPVRRNGSYEAMTACCFPEAVNTASDCYYWCKVPNDAVNGLGSCLRRQGIGRGIVGFHESKSSRSITGGSLVGVTVWALLAVGVLF